MPLHIRSFCVFILVMEICYWSKKNNKKKNIGAFSLKKMEVRSLLVFHDILAYENADRCATGKIHSHFIEIWGNLIISSWERDFFVILD